MADFLYYGAIVVTGMLGALFFIWLSLRGWDE